MPVGRARDSDDFSKETSPFPQANTLAEPGHEVQL